MSRRLSNRILSALLIALCACAGDDHHYAPTTDDAGPEASVAGSPWSSSDASMASDRSVGPRPESYAAVVEILERSCAYVRCHAGTPVGGTLSLLRGDNHAASLVGVPACEYERMNRIEPFQPERSWLMVKLTAAFRDRDDPYAGYIYFEPDPDWEPNQRGCRDQTEDGSPLYGSRMPLTAPNMLPESEIETIRSWIMEGAPHDR
jgi:hypothetical protein